MSHDSEKNSDTGEQESREPAGEEDYRWGSFAPKFLQRVNNPKGFLIVMSIFVFLATFMSDGVLDTNTYALDRRFRLNNIQSAMIVLGFDLAFCFTAVWISYFGTNVNKPRLVAAGAAVFGLGCLIYALPHFTTDNYKIVDVPFLITCPLPFMNTTECFQSENLSGYTGVLLLGTLLMGIGVSSLFTLGLAYLEESVAMNWASVYISLFCAAGFLGSMLGFLFDGAFLLNYFVDFDKGVKNNLIFPGPRYIGAWWVAPLIVMGAAWIVAVFLAGFPRRLPGTSRIREDRISEAHDDGGSQTARTIKFGKLRELPKAFWIIVRNPVFVCITLSACCQAILFNGVTTFMNKFIQNEFHRLFKTASQVSGFILVPSGMLGNILAGIVINRMKWKISSILKFCCVSLFIAVCLFPIGFVHCNQANIAGIGTPYKTATLPSDHALEQVNLTARCNAPCHCQEEYMSPVCGADNITYFSPCHAGCLLPRFEEGDPEPYEYFICSCVRPHGRNAFPDYCPGNCSTLPVFFAGMFFAVIFSFLPITPSLIVTFRVVPEQMRSFAIGVQWFFVRIIGTIPGAYIYDALLSSTCVFWQTKMCDGSRGECHIYDNKDMNIVFIGTSMALNFLAFLFYVIANHLYKPEEKVNAKQHNDTSTDQGSASQNIAYEETDSL